MPPRHPDRATAAALAEALKALANPSRIQLLFALQEPRRVTEIGLQPSRDWPWGDEQRAVTRQAVRGHLRALQQIGVVSAVEDAQGGTRYVVNQARVFRVTEELRSLATAKARVEVGGETLGREATGRVPARPSGPHLVLVRGVQEGRVFALPPPGPQDGWLIGRAKEAPVRLDYDPYVSSAHARVLAREGRHWLLDLRSKNRTHLNWQEVAPGALAPLEAGDLIGLGMSLLLYRR